MHENLQLNNKRDGHNGQPNWLSKFRLGTYYSVDLFVLIFVFYEVKSKGGGGLGCSEFLPIHKQGLSIGSVPPKISGLIDNVFQAHLKIWEILFKY